MELDQWLGIEIRHLAALQAVAEEGTFRGAAARLGYTQSAVSQQIATLERIVGAKLIERPGGPRAVFLTDAGRLVLRHAEAIVARLKAAQADVAAVIDGGAGSLRVGTFQSAGSRLLPDLVRRFRDGWPKVDRAADRVGLRPRAADLRRARRPRPQLRDAAAARGAVRDRRADARPLGAARARRLAARLPRGADLAARGGGAAADRGQALP